MKNDVLIALHKMPQTVFTLRDISLLFPVIPYNNLKERLSYFVKVGGLKKLRRGIYAKDPFDIMELANKLSVPSYISLETVLQKSAIVFQYYESISAISYVSRTISVDGSIFIYRKIKNEILLNMAGIEGTGKVVIASKERAFLDAVFLYRNYHFDNLRPLDWFKVMDLKKIYESKALNVRVDEYYQIYKKEHV